jgi:hypothetical protein
MRILLLILLTLLISHPSWGDIFISLDSLTHKKETQKKEIKRNTKITIKQPTIPKIKIEGIIFGKKKVVIIDGYPYAQGEVYKSCKIENISKQKVLLNCNGYKVLYGVKNEGN